MTDEEKHLSKEATILTGVPMKINVSSSWLTIIALQSYSFLNKSVIFKKKKKKRESYYLYLLTPEYFLLFLVST
jgi:hypothetical protein